MALANFIKPGTYTVVTVKYDKFQKHAFIEALVFEDYTKNNLILKIPYFLNGYHTFPTIKSRTLNAPPEQPSNGDKYIIPVGGGTGAWAEHAAGGIVEFLGGEWVYSQGYVNYTVWVEDEDKYYIDYNGSNTWHHSVDAFDSRRWDNEFNVTVIGGVDGQNQPRDIMRAAYCYLKCRSEFTGVGDS